MSHKLTNDQINDLKEHQIVYLPTELQKTWSNVDPTVDAMSVKETALNTISYAKKIGAEKVIIAGETTLCYHAINVAKEVGIKVLIPTTERIATETLNPDGSKTLTHVFKHVRFREL
jgi:D-arabinose 1-dehydrogenase-like Zn-dependent alcohol dehydrogenase